MKISLKRIVEPVEIETIDGKTEHLILQEMDGSERDEYLEGVFGRMKFGPDGKPNGMSSFKGMHSGLLVCCLKTASGEPVPVEKIQSFRANAIKALYEKAQEINGLNTEGSDEIKNG